MSIRTGFNKVAKLTGAALRSMLWIPKNRWQVFFVLGVSILGQPLLKYTFPTAEDYIASRGYDPAIATQLTGDVETRVFEKGLHRALYNFVDIANVPARIFLEVVDLIDDVFFENNTRDFNPPIFYPKNKSSYSTPPNEYSNMCKIHIRDKDNITLTYAFNQEIVKDFVIFHELTHCSHERRNDLVHDMMNEANADLEAARLLIASGHEDVVQSVIFKRAISNIRSDDIHETSLFLYMSLYTSVEPTAETIMQAKYEFLFFLAQDEQDRTAFLNNQTSIYGNYRISLAREAWRSLHYTRPPTLPSPYALENTVQENTDKPRAPQISFTNS